MSWLPSQCWQCALWLPSSETSPLSAYLCPACIESLPWLTNACARCAQPLRADLEQCPSCAAWQAWQLDAAYSALRYEDPLRNWTLRYKFDGHVALLPLLSALLVMGLQRQRWSAPPSVLLPIPLSRQRLRERRFNQTLLLARRVASRLQLPLLPPQTLRRVRHGAAQSASNIVERQRNVQNSFFVAQSVVGQRIWLVDDVMTSGATLNEAARALKEAGAAFVGSLTLTRRLLQFPES